MTPTTPQMLLGLARKFMESRIFLSAAELDVFSLLAKNPMSAEEAADEMKTTRRGTTVLLNALVALGLLEKKDGRFFCQPELASLLDKDSPTSVMPSVLHSVRGWKRWSALTDVVRLGGDKDLSSASASEKEQEAFIGAMHVIGRSMADAIVAAIKPGAAKNLLDVGGASGTYTQAFLEACPNMRATLFDLPSVIKLAERRLSGTGLLDRITLVTGDFDKDELPKGHDLALLSAIIHQNSPDENVELYCKVYRALEPGGRLVIRDHVMNPEHTQPTSGAIFAVNMLIAGQGGGTYTFDEIRDTLVIAGFINIRLIQTGDQMNALVEGFKPGKIGGHET